MVPRRLFIGYIESNLDHSLIILWLDDIAQIWLKVNLNIMTYALWFCASFGQQIRG